MNFNLVILAAGMGSRYGGLKQVDVIGPGNASIIDYSVYDALRAGFTKVIFVVRADIVDHFDRFQQLPCEVELAIQPGPDRINPDRKKPWGTAHAVLSASDQITGPFAVINADDFYGRAAFEMAISMLSRSQSGLVGYPLEQTLSPFGPVSRALVTQDARNMLREVVEVKEIWKEGEDLLGNVDGKRTPIREGTVSMNFWCFQPHVLPVFEQTFSAFLQEYKNDFKEEFLIPDVVRQLITTHDLQVRQTGANWFGMTYPEDKELARTEIQRLINDHVYPEPLWTTSTT